jgi:hypothetical protein
VEKILASSLSTGHPIHNRTIDAKYSTAAEQPTTPDSNGSSKWFVRVRLDRKTKWHRLRANLTNDQKTLSCFVQAEFFIAFDHRDLSARSLGDDLRVLVVWGRSKTENASCAVWGSMRRFRSSSARRASASESSSLPRAALIAISEREMRSALGSFRHLAKQWSRVSCVVVVTQLRRVRTAVSRNNHT